MNSKSNKTCELHRLLLDHTDKIGLKRSDIYAALSNFNMHYTWKNTRKSYNNKLNISPKSKKEFKLPNGSCSISDIPDYFEYDICK